MTKNEEATTSTHSRHGNAGFIKDQRAFFDELITQEWNSYIDAGWDEARRTEVREILARIPEPERILDVGCGCGFHDFEFAAALSEAEVLGIDYSSQSIKKANEVYAHPRVKRITADILQDQRMLKDLGPFDLITSFQVIEHVETPIEFLKNQLEVLKPGGHIAVVTPNYSRLRNRLLGLTGRPLELVDPLHFTEFSLPQLTLIAQEAGLALVNAFGRTMTLHLRGKILLKADSIVSRKFGAWFPSFADVIGAIFKKA